jgi:hypothetical protein
MALIEVFHVVASQFPINTATATDIPQGSPVSLDANGEVELETTAGDYVVGIAGDSRSQGTTSYTPESGAVNTNAEPPTVLDGSLILGAYGDSQRYTQNRVADNYNEVLASGKMTVYHSGGEFWTDQYDTADTFAPMAPLYAEAAGNWSETSAGNAYIAGFVLTSPTAYPSGVPGTGPNAVGFSALPEGGNSMSWGNFLHMKLVA